MTIAFQNVALEWPNGQTVFQQLNFSLNKSIYGLVGVNGAGKTTLAKILVGELIPTKGTVQISGEKIVFFRQEEDRKDISVLEFLIDFDLFSDSKKLSLLDSIPLDRSCIQLSGGEWTRVRLTKLLLEGASFVIMDEPTNHLDREGRKLLFDFIKIFDGGLLLISHDRELLGFTDNILELTNHGIELFAGNFEDYQSQSQRQRDILEDDLKMAKRKRNENEEKRIELVNQQTKRMSKGKKDAAKGGIPKILLGGRKRKAQQTLGSIDKETSAKLNIAVSEAYQRFEKVKRDPVMFSHLPEVSVHQNKLIFEARNLNIRFPDNTKNLWNKNLNFSLHGPARLRVSGGNGSGKSTFFSLLMDKKIEGTVEGSLNRGSVHFGIIDQEYQILNFEKDIFQNIREVSALSDIEIRNLLSSFLFQGDTVYRNIETLSGGEKLRLSLAKVLMMNPTPEVLILDEPTNNLDLVNIEFLENLLLKFDGVLIVASHDTNFSENIELNQEIVFYREE